MNATVDRPDVFISYAREDRALASAFAEWCAAGGWVVWWDQEITPGRKWDQAIERALTDARCVLVLWSAASVVSDWVKTEAAEAARRGTLVPVLVGPVEPPLEFRRVQALDLSHWDGRADDPALPRLRSALGELIGRPPLPATPTTAQRPLPARTPAWRVGAAAGVVVALVALAWWQPWRPAQIPAGPATVAQDRPSQRAPGLAGEAVARLAQAQRQALLEKADASSLYWPFMLKDEGGALLLEQTVLLAVEAVRRGGGEAAESELRKALALMTRPLRRLAHGDAVTALAFAPDGQTIATASADWTAALWETGSGRQIAVLKHGDSVRDIAFSPDGHWLATAGSDKAARLWQAGDGKPVLTLAHGEPVRRVLFSGDGRLLATLTDSGKSVRLWSLPEGRELRTLTSANWLRDIVLSDDGRHVIGIPPPNTIGATVQVWDVTSGARVAAPTVGRKAVESAATHRDVLAIGEWGQDGSVVSLWRLGLWAAVGQVSALHGTPVVDLSADATQLAIGSASARYGQIAAAAVGEGAVRAVPRSARKNGGVRRVVISADGRVAAATALDSTAEVVDLVSGEQLLLALAPEGSEARPALSSDGHLLLTSGGNTADLWETRPAEALRAACQRVQRDFTAAEWQRWFAGEPPRKTCTP
jgi:WD40 repeat protein